MPTKHPEFLDWEEQKQHAETDIKAASASRLQLMPGLKAAWQKHSDQAPQGDEGAPSAEGQHPAAGRRGSKLHHLSGPW